MLVFEPTSNFIVEQQDALLQYIRRGGRVWFRVHIHMTVFVSFGVETLDGVVAETKTQSDHWDHPMLYLEPIEVNLPLLSEERSVVFGTNDCIFSQGASKVVSDRHLLHLYVLKDG